MTETYKIEATAIMKNLFIFRGNIYNIRNSQNIGNENKNTVRYGLKAKSYETPCFWASLTEKYKHQISIREFKEKIKNWKCETYIC